MSSATPEMRDLAIRLIAAMRDTASSAQASSPPAHEAAAVCESLRKAVTRIVGVEGFAALLRRAVVLASAEAPALRGVRINDDLCLEGLEPTSTQPESNAAVALAAHFLTLLATFIGQPLTLRIAREGWPDADLGPLEGDPAT